MRKLLAKDLKIKFVEIFTPLDTFSYENGNPFLIKIRSKRYFVFLKNLSPAYFKNSPDVTRIQLPYSNHFRKILKAKIPFVILGFDVDNDTFVCWNPYNIKERLNARSNVSLYSRASLQSMVNPNEFKEGFLSNGEKIIVFKRGKLIDFIDNISSLFAYKINQNSKFISSELNLDFETDKIYEVKDKNLISSIKPLLKKNKVLDAVNITMKYYAGKYKNMKFKDWFKIVNDLYQKIDL